MAKKYFIGTKADLTSYISYGDTENIFEEIPATCFSDF